MPPVPPTGPTGEDPLDQLQQLAVLRDAGGLSQAEYEARKALVLSPHWPAAVDPNAAG